jgi:hypothetical protein
MAWLWIQPRGIWREVDHLGQMKEEPKENSPEPRIPVPIQGEIPEWLTQMLVIGEMKLSPPLVDGSGVATWR